MTTSDNGIGLSSDVQQAALTVNEPADRPWKVKPESVEPVLEGGIETDWY